MNTTIYMRVCVVNESLYTTHLYGVELPESTHKMVARPDQCSQPSDHLTPSGPALLIKPVRGRSYVCGHAPRPLGGEEEIHSSESFPRAHYLLYALHIILCHTCGLEVQKTCMSKTEDTSLIHTSLNRTLFPPQLPLTSVPFAAVCMHVDWRCDGVVHIVHT